MLLLNFVDLKCVHKSTFAFQHSLLDEASLEFSDDKHALPDWPWLYPQLLKSIPNIVMMTDQQPVALSFFHNCFFWVTLTFAWPQSIHYFYAFQSLLYVVIVVFVSQNRVKPEETTTLAHFNREQPAVDVYLYSAAPALEIWSFQSWGNVTSFDRIDPEPSGRKASPELWLWYLQSHTCSSLLQTLHAIVLKASNSL